MPFLIYNTVIFKNKNAKSLYNNGESTKNKKIITLLKKQMKDQVLLDLILSSLEGFNELLFPLCRFYIFVFLQTVG